MIPTKSIRFRLTVWYLLAIAFTLAVFGTTAYYLLRNNLYRSLDQSLRARSTELQGTIVIEGSRVRFDQKIDEFVLIYDASGGLLQRLGPNTE
ncbi:MAG: hypothetical protein JW775_05410, partial [Candidatus Aminicenantes bacterium]|nr:hypothetical protein [Candidatus Aminicenantes bacterium]